MKLKVTIVVAILLLLNNFFSISDAKGKKKWRIEKSKAVAEEKWDNKWNTNCGLSNSQNKYPWIAALYSYERISCYGTIISPYHVVTVLHCFPPHYIHHSSKLSKKRFTIIAGRQKRNLFDSAPSQQNRKIREVIRYRTSKMFAVAKEQDLVIIVVDKPFKFTDDVQPACVDWQSFYEEWYFRDGNEGIIAGWNAKKVEVKPCSSSVQYWQKYLCWENLPEYFRKKYFGNDKFCARYIEDNSTCGAAIGAGLFYEAKDRYFLRGVTSVLDEDLPSYVIYRKISNYLEWLKLSMMKIPKSTQVFNSLVKPIYEKDIGCVLPQHVQHGKFSLTTGKAYPEDTWVPLNTTILLSCIDSNETALSFQCLSFDKWDPPISSATCRKPGSCPTLQNSDSENVYCKLDDEFIDCKEPAENATAIIICEPFHIFPGYKPTYKCQNRKWDPPFVPCMLECGTKRVDASTLAIGGVEASLNEYPWVIAIYYESVQICGGTLISRYYVLSAAHCFMDHEGMLMSKEKYIIIAGKYHRSINIDESGSQRRKIKSLHIHENYRGSNQKYRDDIALIELDGQLTVSLEVQPVCIDWENNYESSDFILGKEGIVAGWGFTREGGSPSDVLKKLIMPFQPRNECLAHLPPDFSREFIASDKFCAGYVNKNTNVCEGDSGGGIYFKSDGSHYFIRGIVSLTRRSAVGCDSNHFSLYTKLSKYLAWIERITRKVL